MRRSRRMAMSTKDDKIYYLAGPMSGRASFNYPEFFEAAASLRAQGHYVVNPAEQDEPEVMRKVMQNKGGDLSVYEGEDVPTWGQFLAHDVKLVADGVDAIAVLPDWQYSKGACTEVWIATLLNKPVYPLASRHYSVSTGFARTMQGNEWCLGSPMNKADIAAKLMGKLLA
jgi:hypothetical protein